MLKKFYEKVLPSQGVYCVTGISPDGKARNYFCDTLEIVYETIEKSKAKQHNTFVALSSFDSYSRKADNAIYCRSFFIDLDVGDTKDYKSKDEAIKALDNFITNTELPMPTRVDSGRGIHAYWAFDEDIPSTEWKVYAEKFKAFCLDNNLHIDPSVSADAARILRCPNTLNYKETPPLPTSIMDEEISVFEFGQFKEFLGEETSEELNIEALLASLPKGDLSDEQKAFLKTDNFETLFETIAVRSLEGDGCAQITEILMNPNGISYDTWVGGLSIAAKCDDATTAIHKMSEDYEGYTYEGTIKKAFHSGIEGARRCETFARESPSKCEGCKHRGKISSPIQLGKLLRIATPVIAQTEGALWAPTSSFTLPEALYPFMRGVTGGIYYMPPNSVDKKGNVIKSDPILVSHYDLYPTRRVLSSNGDGFCLYMKVVLPHDGTKEFMLPSKVIYAQEKLKETLASNGVMFNPIGNGIQLLMSYLYKWGAYLGDNESAGVMRNQMGWSDDSKHESFIIGNKEVLRDGLIIDAPIDVSCRNVAKALVTSGSYEQWLESANYLSNESMELHAFTMLCGFGSILMNYTNTPGVTLALTGESGAAKTGAMYAALSAWGDPKKMKVASDDGSTANGLVTRYLKLHNLPFGIDEIGNIDPKALSSIIHKISAGSAKIRVQGSINAEREIEESASLIGIMTANGELYNKLNEIKKNPQGEAARLVELKFYEVPKFMVNNPGIGKTIFNGFVRNYGWAGEHFVRGVMTHTDKAIMADLKIWEDRFKADFGNYEPYRYYENLMGVAMVAGKILSTYCGLVLPLERIYNFIMSRLIGTRDNTSKINDVDYEVIVGEFMNNNINNTLAIHDGKVSMEPRNRLLVRIDGTRSIVAIDAPEFNKYLASMQVSSSEFEFGMAKRGISIYKKKMRLGTGWKHAMALANNMCYVIDSTTMVKDIINPNGD